VIIEKFEKVIVARRPSVGRDYDHFGAGEVFRTVERWDESRAGGEVRDLVFLVQVGVKEVPLPDDAIETIRASEQLAALQSEGVKDQGV
jgi:hypothetical protein